MTRSFAGLAAALVLVLGAGAAGAQDVAEGEKVFKKCGACHKVQDGQNGVGPHLHAIVGRPVAGVEGYKYSDAMKAYAEGGRVWTTEELQAYLANPKGVVKGTKMSFAGLKKADELTNVIAYLATLN